MSRKASPKRFAPNTAALMNTPGKIAIQIAVSKNRMPSVDSMRPQEGAGGGTPRPRKLREASARMAPLKPADAMTIYGAVTLGRMCCSMMRQLAQPMACAASTYRLSLTESTAERMTRLVSGMRGMAMAMMTLSSDGPSIVTMAIANTRPG